MILKIKSSLICLSVYYSFQFIKNIEKQHAKIISRTQIELMMQTNFKITGLSFKKNVKIKCVINQ